VYARNSIVNVPLLASLIVSIALHVAALYGKDFHRPAQPRLETGRTVVQLTLLPSIASKESPKPEPLNAEQPQKETSPEPKPEPVPTPEPVVEPSPEPVEEPQPEPEQPPAPSPQPPASLEQNASLQEEKGVLTEAQSIEGIRAAYPRVSQRRGEEGTVVLSIEVLASGKAGKVEVVKSSGYRRLDAAALKAAKNSSYTPAMQFGRTVDSTLIQPLVFELTNND